ncbi:acyl-CoA dehydrogenase [Pseudomonas sp. 21LCFQ010]|uniref:acyl-CoA dehydrogenase n=1 Tax=Pseudomonas sp. 21LCFQ010 TaxID=2957506 RepID=UPI0020985253|nr:acyl-CoA dehydrogenase [Pseudomonas sp. 21LCFQ010]MCO8161869.1 acyl-CoA dehydrogenase [Pseudomonas sp. 21LCFQ010]
MIDTLERLLSQQALARAGSAGLGECLRAMVSQGLDQLPLPASGQTLARWQALAEVAGHSLGLCKLYEGHTDALAIIQELDAPAVPNGSTWGMWAAEPPQARLRVSAAGAGLRVDGLKAWCSGAAVLSHALVTAWDEQGCQQLVAVPLAQTGVQVTDDGWHAVGMAATASVEVRFDQASGWAVGGPGDYLQRPGFWQGAIGIAACWYGAASALALSLPAQLSTRPEPHGLAHLGAVDAALSSASLVLQDAAKQLDDRTVNNYELLARRSRASVENTVETVIQHVGRALGAGPYCKDAGFARMAADLPVFIRQSHAERDLATLGEQVVQTRAHRGWRL